MQRWRLAYWGIVCSGRQRQREHRESLLTLDRFLERDMLFHREIAVITGNPIFPASVEALINWASAYYQSIVRAPGAEELTLSEHQEIIDAIARRSATDAAEAIRVHVLNAKRRLFESTLLP